MPKKSDTIPPGGVAMTKLKPILTMNATQFPPLVFICTNCGSPEVMIKWEGNEKPLRCSCLDCKQEWFEGKENMKFF